MKTSKIRRSAKDQECTVRIPQICNFNPETTVLAHLNGGGMGTKNPDYLAAYCCSSCHDAYDVRVHGKNYTHDQIVLMFYEGIFRTQRILIDKGLLVIK